jgi:hypothetical protein
VVRRKVPLSSGNSGASIWMKKKFLLEGEHIYKSKLLTLEGKNVVASVIR